MGRAPEPDLLQLIELQEACLERFATFCPPEVRSAWDAARQAMPLAELERLRRKLLAAGQGGALPATLAEPWFACCSARLDHLRAIEDLLAGGLRSACAARIAALQRDPDDPEALLRMLEEAAEGRPELAGRPLRPAPHALDRRCAAGAVAPPAGDERATGRRARQPRRTQADRPRKAADAPPGPERGRAAAT
ncbi:nitrate- and nitrite sensing domain-containing protein [Thauera sp.]|uniref:nitrate- and nitrite sensing domain-containing protein n=1 Tax=Thauera sp. TaxID=1905334 RepID=UPI002638D8AB|nr:nitrate- and nitrite sensing domain-containing protein [Thauera sp.]